MNKTLAALTEAGQSIWIDNISRGMLESGAMQNLIDDGVRGVTSNPSIFQKAICDTPDYDDSMQAMIAKGLPALEIYDKLTQEDIAVAADLFRPLYDSTDGRDGFVSLEVNPKLAFDTERTISEARRLYRELNRPNVMIKIPATEEGIPAVQTALSEGINVNVTLIFSVDMYAKVMDAYLVGAEQYLKGGGKPERLASVASFFVSRVDSNVDARLEKLIASGKAEAKDLMGKAAVANSKLAFKRYEHVFGGERFAGLRAKGMRVQRPLWASTSVKNPAYSPLSYVEPLVGPDTVNTVPPQTLEDIRGGFDVQNTVADGMDAAEKTFERLETLGISMKEVTDELRVAGVDAFAASFDKLIADVDRKREALAK